MRRVPIVHSGRIEASAFFVDAAMIGETEARRRVIELWDRGSRVLAFDGGYFVTVAPPRWVSADEALGAPFVTQDGALTSAPGLDGPNADILFYRHGATLALDFADLETIDIAAWLAIDAFTVVHPQPLGEPPPPAKAVLRPPASVRAVLGDKIPPPSEAIDEMRDALAAAQTTEAAGDGEDGRAVARTDPPWWTRLLESVQRMLGNGETAQTDAEAVPHEPSRWARAFDRWASKLLNLSRINRLLGRRQAEYMRKLLDMLDDNRVDDILRHAIPLGGGSGGRPRPAWGVPSPRDKLRITAKGGVGSSMMVGDSLYDLLQQQYRRLFERLEREGRIEEAAFVLAELLGETEEAVAFLEKHGELIKAAELAEGRNADPGLIVRQWILAGEWTRAIRIARRHNAFADALLRLGASHRDEAKTLRLLWADALAEAGQFMAAVDTVWPVEEARNLTIPWMESAIALGGPAGAKMMVRALSLSPNSFDRIGPKVIDLLEDDDQHGLYVRRAFAEALALAHTNPALAALGRPTVRALCRDGFRHGATADRTVLSKILRIADDPTLRADLPAVVHKPRLGTDRTFELTIDENDAGTVDIHDASMLASGRFLIALGEAGTLHLTRDGRRIKHYDQPAHSLVVSDEGHRAIAIGRRGQQCRLARLDLVHQRATYWCEADLSIYASTFDGWQWFVASGRNNALEAIDATAAGYDSLWRNADCSAHFLARNDKRLSVLAGPPLERWSFDLPSLTLRARSPVELDAETHRRFAAIDADGRVSLFELQSDPPEAEETTVVRSWELCTIGDTGSTRHPVPLPPRMHLEAADRWGRWCAFAESASGATVVRVVDTDTGRIAARVALVGANRCVLRFEDERHLVVADDRGRLLVVDYEAGVLLRSLRVSA